MDGGWPYDYVSRLFSELSSESAVARTLMLPRWGMIFCNSVLVDGKGSPLGMREKW